MGNLNTTNQNKVRPLPQSFCLDHDYFHSDKALLPVNTNFFLSEDHTSTSWLNHCLSSSAVYSCILEMAVLYISISLLIIII